MIISSGTNLLFFTPNTSGVNDTRQFYFFHLLQKRVCKVFLKGSARLQFNKIMLSFSSIHKLLSKWQYPSASWLSRVVWISCIESHISVGEREASFHERYTLPFISHSIQFLKRKKKDKSLVEMSRWSLSLARRRHSALTTVLPFLTRGFLFHFIHFILFRFFFHLLHFPPFFLLYST